jgi:hypothetical protein
MQRAGTASPSTSTIIYYGFKLDFLNGMKANGRYYRSLLLSSIHRQYCSALHGTHLFEEPLENTGSSEGR